LIIGVYLEQYQAGGVDAHLLSLIEKWPVKNDRFVLFTNLDNQGLQVHAQSYKRLKIEVVTFSSVSYISMVTNLMLFPLGKYLRYLAYPFLPIYFFRQYFQARSLFQKNKIDFILADNGAYPGAWGALASILAAKKLKIKRLLLIHHNATPYQFLRKSFEVIVDRAVADATTIVTVSEATKETVLKNRFAMAITAKINVIHNGTNIDKTIHACTELDKFKNQFKDKKFLGIVGRVEAYKGHEELIRGLALLDSIEKDFFEIAFIGSVADAERQRLEKIANEVGVFDKLHFLGFVTGDSKSIISYLDLLLVLTRDFEGFGLTLIEAMAVNVPTIATRVGAIPEFVTHLENGYLISPKNAGEVSEALRDFLKHPEVWKKRTEKARNQLEMFSDFRMAQNYQVLIKEISDH
jgi:glycosyltransferase involved in cell wall biosynthesis